jgi:hypothetical protein
VGADLVLVGGATRGVLKVTLGHHPQVVAGTDLDLVEGPVRDPPWRTDMFLGHQ